MVRDGLLDRVQALMILVGDRAEVETLGAMGAWVREGGVLFLAVPLPHTVEGIEAEWPCTCPSAQEAGVGGVACGDGFVVRCSSEWEECRQQINRAVHQPAEAAPWATQLVASIDARFDGIIATATRERLLYANSTDAKVTRPTPDGGTLELAPRSLVALPWKPGD